MLRSVLFAAASAILILGEGVRAGEPCVCKHPWAGVYPTVLTPWNCDCTVDEAALEAQLRYQMCGGVQGLLVLGSLGEGECASPSARAQVLAVTTKVVHGCIPVVVGIHTCNVDVALAQMHEAKQAGAAAVLVKYKGNPHAKCCEVLAFYQALNDSNILPIIYYHYPSDTHLKLSPAELACIIRLPNVVGAKISTLDPREFQDIVAKTRCCDKFYLSGTALNLTQFMDDGGHGAMCPEAVLLPKQTVCVFQQYCQGNRSKARSAQEELFVLSPAFRGGLTTERTARKKVMWTQDLNVRLPMQDYQSQARLKATLNGLGVPTSSKVSCPLPGLSERDARTVEQVVGKVRRRHCLCTIP